MQVVSHDYQQDRKYFHHNYLLNMALTYILLYLTMFYHVSDHLCFITRLLILDKSQTVTS